MTSTRKKPQTERISCPEFCIVCGLAASGYHYEAPSCTSCKTFFRRTVLQGKLFGNCFKNGACNDGNSDTRLCRTCRFERCVDGGMNPMLIISLKDPESNPVVQKLMRKRAGIDEPSTSSEEDLPVALKRAPTVIECKIDRIIGGLLYLENAQRRLRISTYSPRISHGYRLEGLLLEHSRLSMMFQDKYEQHSMTPPLPGEDLPMQQLPEAVKDWAFADGIIAIEYLKTFEFFHSLSLSDKKALTRHVANMAANLSLSFSSYEKGSDVTLHPDGTRPYGGKVPKDKPTAWILHHGVIEKIKCLEMDRKEYVLLKALIICNPAIEELSMSYKDKLEKERLMYAQALMSYVMSRRGPQNGPSTFAAMMSLIDVFSHLLRKNRELHVLMKALMYKPGLEITNNLIDDLLD